MYHFTDGGLNNVWLNNGYTEKDTGYGNAVSFDDLEGLARAICEALAKKPGRLAGSEFRYLRTALPTSQKALGKILGSSEQAVAKWEKAGKVPKAEDYLIRVIYAESRSAKDLLGPAVSMLTAIDAGSHMKFVLTRTNELWSATVERQPELEAA